MGEEHEHYPWILRKYLPREVNSELNIRECPEVIREKEGNDPGREPWKQKQRCRNMARKYAGNKSFWNFWDKIKSSDKRWGSKSRQGAMKEGSYLILQWRIEFHFIHIIPIQRQSRWSSKDKQGQWLKDCYKKMKRW